MSLPTVGDVIAAFFAGGHQAEAAEVTIGPRGGSAAEVTLGPSAEPELESSL